MRIAIDVRNIGKGRTGDEVVFRDLVRHLAQIDEKNTYALLIDTRPPEEMQRIAHTLGVAQAQNFTLHACGSGNKFWWNLWTAQRFCRRHRCDIYHTQYITPFFMPRATKIVTHIHDVSFHVYGRLLRWTDRFFLNLLIPLSLRRATHVVAVSQFTKDEIITYYGTPADKITVVPNAVMLHSEPGVTAQTVRAQYNLPQHYILALGTMQPRKNIPFLIDVFARLRTRMPELHLVLVGKKAHNFDDAIEQHIASSPDLGAHIVRLGYISDAEKYIVYQLADAFVFPSLYEGFSVPILEALTAQTLVVASDIPPHREVGSDCILYGDPYNVDQYTGILYDGLVGAVRPACTTDASRQFSWVRSAQVLRTVYEQIAARNRADA